MTYHCHSPLYDRQRIGDWKLERRLKIGAEGASAAAAAGLDST
jgi:hypothetical protein